MPISACIAKTHIMSKWEKGAHGGTYGGNPVACAAAKATLDVVANHLVHIEPLSEFCSSY